MAKAKKITAKVSRVKGGKRMSKGALYPFEVWAVRGGDGKHYYEEAFGTEREAGKYIKDNPDLLAPVIVHVDIPAMEY